MNAYELADIADRWAYKESAEYLTDAANMLRQQADRIAELEKCLFQMQNACIDLTKQNSEPVVWIDPKELEDHELTSTAVSKNKMYPQDIPLYTTPQIKELSDEEINDLIVNKVTDADMIRQALKKASEK